MFIGSRTNPIGAGGSGSGSGSGGAIGAEWLHRDSTDSAILANLPALKDIYTWLGVEELTASAAVKRFTVPAVLAMPGPARLSVMRDLSTRWDAFRSDEELVTLLKTVKFVPVWDVEQFSVKAGGANTTDGLPEEEDTIEEQMMMKELAFVQGGAAIEVRKPEQLFSWKSKELRAALAGKCLGQYFSPPWLRDPGMHAMCTGKSKSKSKSRI